MIYVLLLALLFPSGSFAQTYSTLTMVRPVATGAAGTGLHANNRVYRAYSGITYQIHADAIGGKWPYTYSLSNAPAGMSIVAGPCTDIGPTGCTAGTITWTNPTSTASNITVTVTDALGTQVTGTWSITVSTTIGSGGFCFVDATNGNDTTGNGSLATPYQTLFKVYSSCDMNSVVYFRAGTYNFTGFTPTGSGDCFNTTAWSTTNSKPTMFIGYPGETVTIDFEGTAGSQTGKCIRASSPYMWFENFRMDNVGSIGFKLDNRSLYGVVIRNVTGLETLSGADGSNSGFFFWVKYATPREPSIFDTVQNSSFSNISASSCALKLYSTDRLIVENSNFANSVDAESVVAVKDGNTGFAIRANTFQSNIISGVGGNLDDGDGNIPTGGSIYHNLFLGSGTASNQGAIDTKSRIDPMIAFEVYRNTFIGGQVNLVNLFSTDGVWTLRNNVIVNATVLGGSCPDRIVCGLVDWAGPYDYTRLDVNSSNVRGANNGTIANATTGALVGSYRTTYLGVAGYELSTVVGSSITGSVGFTGSVRIQ